MKAKLVAFSRPSEDEGFNVKHTSVFFLMLLCPGVQTAIIWGQKFDPE